MKIHVTDLSNPTILVINPWYKGKGIKLIDIVQTVPF